MPLQTTRNVRFLMLFYYIVFVYDCICIVCDGWWARRWKKWERLTPSGEAERLLDPAGSIWWKRREGSTDWRGRWQGGGAKRQKGVGRALYRGWNRKEKRKKGKKFGWRSEFETKNCFFLYICFVYSWCWNVHNIIIYSKVVESDYCRVRKSMKRPAKDLRGDSWNLWQGRE